MDCVPRVMPLFAVVLQGTALLYINEHLELVVSTRVLEIIKKKLLAGSDMRNGIVRASRASDPGPMSGPGNQNAKQQKSAGDDRSTLTLILMGRVIRSLKQWTNGPPSKINL